MLRKYISSSIFSYGEDKESMIDQYIRDYLGTIELGQLQEVFKKKTYTKKKIT